MKFGHSVGAFLKLGFEVDPTAAAAVVVVVAGTGVGFVAGADLGDVVVVVGHTAVDLVAAGTVVGAGAVAGTLAVGNDLGDAAAVVGNFEPELTDTLRESRRCITLISF